MRRNRKTYFSILFLLCNAFLGGCAAQFGNEKVTHYLGCMKLTVEKSAENEAVRTSTRALGLNVANNETGASVSMGYSNITVTRVPDQGVYQFSLPDTDKDK